LQRWPGRKATWPGLAGPVRLPKQPRLAESRSAVRARPNRDHRALGSRGGAVASSAVTGGVSDGKARRGRVVEHQRRGVEVPGKVKGGGVHHGGGAT
jgi:hypothetical protein